MKENTNLSNKPNNRKKKAMGAPRQKCLYAKVMFAMAAIAASFGTEVCVAGERDASALTLKAAGFTGLHFFIGESLEYEFKVAPLAPRWRPMKSQVAPEIVDRSTIEYRDHLFFMKRKGWRWVKAGEAPFAYNLKVDPAAAAIDIKAEKGRSVTYDGVMFTVKTNGKQSDAAAMIKLEGGGEQRVSLSPPTGTIAQKVRSIALPLRSGGQPVTVKFDRPVTVHSDHGEFRFWLLGQGRRFKPGAARVDISFPEVVHFDAEEHPGFSTTDHWYPLNVENDYSADSVIGMRDWLDAPAGKHGWLGRDKDKFIFADGEPAVFWGSNLSWADMAPEPEIGVKHADRFAKYGINLMRFHKFLDGAKLGTLLDHENREQLDPETTARFDRFHAELKKRGIYVGWSPIYIYHPGDEKTALALEEIRKMKAPVGIYSSSFHQLVNMAPDLQDIYIRRVLTALNHRNPVTGLRYADDPALAYIELHNEDMIFKDNTARMLDQCPTYRKQINRDFSEWLAAFYGGEEGFRKAWGVELKPGESLENQNVRVVFRPKEPATFSRRELDSFRFLYEFQNRWYERFTKAIRDAGYQGVIVAGCWQSKYWLPHLYNLFSDYRVGPIDRHNYMRPQVEMIRKPGAGLLAVGIQQVIDRPFAISEWSSAGPWYASMNAIIAAYGMGLQGWDFSGQFSGRNRTGEIMMTARPGINNTTDAYPQLAVFPALARMVRRGDVRASEPVSIRRVGLEQLYDGKIGYEEKLDLTGGAYLMGSIGSTPHQALAVGRTVLELSRKTPDVPLEQIDLGKYWDPSRRRIRSVTGELEWHYDDLGYFTIDTEGTAAVAGNAGGQTHDLKQAAISFDISYATVFVTARNPGRTLADDDEILVTALARSAQKGDVVNDRDNEYLVTADSDNPLVAEPFTTVLSLKRDAPFEVFALDHEGRRKSDAPLDMRIRQDEQGWRTVILDGGKHKTPYYLIKYRQQKTEAHHDYE